jgi:uncharacterized protein with HEPN domain
VEEILAFTEGMDEGAFAADARTQKAVLADFAILGEAVTHVPEEIAHLHPNMPWRSMRAMRNLVIHAYLHVEPAIVWETIQNDLPDLATKIRAILDTED